LRMRGWTQEFKGKALACSIEGLRLHLDLGLWLLSNTKGLTV
jgi:hypothetical protein